MRILITGGAGFIGFELVKYFLSRGNEVVVLDKVKGDLDKIADPKLKVIVGGIEDPSAVEQALEGVDAIIHSAWSFAEQPMEAFKIDVEGGINLLEKAVEKGVKQIIFPSSAVIYGEPVQEPITEEHPLLVEKSRAFIHALTKYAVEKLFHYYYVEKNLPYTVFRIWWAFSDERAPGRTMRALVDKALANEEIEVPAKAGGSIVYTGDIALAFEKALFNEKAYGQVFNIASFYMPWRELVERLVRVARSSSKIKVVEDEAWTGPGFMTGVWKFDTTKLAELLEFKPDDEERKQRFEATLKRMVEQRRALKAQ